MREMSATPPRPIRFIKDSGLKIFVLFSLIQVDHFFAFFLSLLHFVAVVVSNQNQFRNAGNGTYDEHFRRLQDEAFVRSADADATPLTKTENTLNQNGEKEN